MPEPRPEWRREDAEGHESMLVSANLHETGGHDMGTIPEPFVNVSSTLPAFSGH